MKKIKRGKNHGVYEPKKSSPEPQSGTEELDSGMYGANEWARTTDLGVMSPVL